MIEFSEVARQLQWKFATLKPYDRYKFFLSQYYLASYKSGKENFMQTDCSGILSGALYLSGYNIRADCQFFFDNVFVVDLDQSLYMTKYAVAFVVKLQDDVCFHLLPHIENNVMLDVREHVEFVTWRQARDRYTSRDQVIMLRTVPEKILSAYSVSLLAATKIDEELSILKGE